MDGVGSFGAGRTGFVRSWPNRVRCRPDYIRQTILRVLSWIFSLVVFASIINEGYVNTGSERLNCVFNKNLYACHYGEFVGLASLLQCTLFFLVNYKFSSISSVKERKKIVMLDVGISGFGTVLYFVSFFFLTDQWYQTKTDDMPLNHGAAAARAAIVFSFFSILTWACLTVCAVQRYLLGTDMTLFTTEHMDGGSTEATELDQGSSFPENNTVPTNQFPVC